MEQTFGGQPQVKGSREDPSGHSDWIQIFGFGFGSGEDEGDAEGAELGVGVEVGVGGGHLQVFGSRAEPSGQRDWIQKTGGHAHVTESLNLPSGQTEPPSQIAASAGLGLGDGLALADRRSIH